jgi:hypothetical protein
MAEGYQEYRRIQLICQPGRKCRSGSGGKVGRHVVAILSNGWILSHLSVIKRSGKMVIMTPLCRTKSSLPCEANFVTKEQLVARTNAGV